MINKKYFHLVFVTAMAFFMAGVMSFALTAINIGFSEYFVLVWLQSFLLSFVLALPTALIVSPFVRHITEKITG